MHKTRLGLIGSVFTGLLLVIPGLSASRCLAQQKNQMFVDASEAYPDPGPSSFQTGSAKSADGRVIGLNERFLTLDGRPWLPVMGEFHYTRVPEAEWEDEILKMKAAGVQIIATYVIWLHHEEIEGQFDWTGDRDLRRFAELCGKHGMYVYARIGPWAHGEARHGGFPDWLLDKGPTRTNDPVYMSYVAKYYAAIGQQLHGLLWKDGGPVIGVQVENEYSDRKKGGGEEYILALKKLAIASGLDVPLYSVTGWDNAVVPAGAVLPVFGGYPDAPWDASLKDLGPGEVYAFRFGSRVTGNMGMMGGRAATDPSINKRPDTPFITAEMGGGIQDTYHRRPVLSADDIVAMFPVMLGSGVNLYGTYMFQGGENPNGKLTTLQESQATGYPTDVPVKSYDFQAPLSEFGEERESFRKLKVVNYFLHDFGAELAPMLPHAPSIMPTSPQDLSVARLSVRTRDESGFLFLNNYIRGVATPARPALQINVKLPGSTLLIPAHPVDVPSGAYFIWPINLNLDGTVLRYSTAQPFTRVRAKGETTYFFFCIPGVRCEFAFAEEPGLTIDASKAKTSHQGGITYVTDVTPDIDMHVVLKRRDGSSTRLVVLTQKQSEDAWKARVGGEERLLITKQQFFASQEKITLHSNEDPAFSFMLYPAITTALHASAPLNLSQSSAGMTNFSAHLPEVRVQVTETKIEDAKDVPPIKLGPPISWRPQGVAETPAESVFANSAKWKLKFDKDPLKGVSNIFLHIDYVGDIARFSDDSYLLDDNFFNGTSWTIGMRRFLQRDQNRNFQLSILPLRIDSPIFLEGPVRKALPSTGQIDWLRSIRATPEYELTIQTTP